MSDRTSSQLALVPYRPNIYQAMLDELAIWDHVEWAEPM